jgi:hypothetical protein
MMLGMINASRICPKDNSTRACAAAMALQSSRAKTAALADEGLAAPLNVEMIEQEPGSR